MTKPKATPKKRDEDKAMDNVLRRMLATPPNPMTPPTKPKAKRSPKKHDAVVRRNKK